MRRRLRRNRGKFFGPSAVLARTVTSHFTFHFSLSLLLAVRKTHCFGSVNETEAQKEAKKEAR
jgi:hypothetical protein